MASSFTWSPTIAANSWACQLTSGNIDDRQPVPSFAKRLFDKLFSDKGYKGYISHQLVAQLLEPYNVHLVTFARANV